MAAWRRLRALVVKELLAVVRDPRGRLILVIPPIVQLVVFAFAATLDVANIEVVLLNRDDGPWSRELVRRIEGSPSFRRVTAVAGAGEMESAIVHQQALAAVHIGPTFSRDIEAGAPAAVQVVLDGRRSNAAQIVAGYLNRIVADLGVASGGPAFDGRAAGGVSVATRNWFNPNLDDRWRMVPSLIGAISLLMGLIVTALSVAREREAGTFDQLRVSPLRTHEIMLGKMLAPVLISLAHVTLFVLTAVFLFGIPLRGALWLLYAAALAFQFSVVGVGLLVSSAAATQQQAILGAFVFLVPAMVLSGFITPVENMPPWLQAATRLNPLRYFLVIINGLFLKDLPLSEVVVHAAPMLLLGVVALAAAAVLFRRRLE